MSLHEIIYRPLEVSEWQEYKRIRLQALQCVPHAFGSTYDEMVDRPDEYWQTRLRDSASGNNCYFVFAMDGERAVGMMGTFWGKEKGVAEVVAVYVDEEYQGRGIAKRLLQDILAKLSENEDLVVARLQMNQRQAAAFALYTRAGFRAVKELEFTAPDGRVDNDYIMERKLQ